MTTPVTVMHVVYAFRTGGLENGLVNLIDGLPCEDYRHHVVCLAGHDPAFAARVRRGALTLHDLGKREGNDPRAWWRLARLVRRVRPQVVHTRNFGALEFLLPALGAAPGARRVHGEHGWDVHDLDGSNRRHQRIRRVVGGIAHRFVTVSRELERYLTERVGLPAEKVTQIYNGVDASRFRPPARRAPAVRVIGTVGRLRTVKNHALALEAFARLLERLPPGGADALTLRIVGDGPLRGELEARAAALGCAGRVEFAGERADVPEQMRAMDVFVLPSLNEGISNTVLEAMASGLPVVATDVGGNAELVADGTTGRLVPPGDAGAMAGALHGYVTDPALARAHGDAARAQVEARFSLDRMIGAYDALYRGLVAGRA